MRQPSINPVSLKYGATTAPYSASNPHAGTDYSYYSDLAKTKPNPIWVAPEDIVITLVKTTTTGDCGRTVEFRSLDAKRTYRACHNSEIYVSSGQRVNEGDRIAKMGATGAAVGAHLHLVMWVNGLRVDPYETIKKGEEMPPTVEEIKQYFVKRLGRKPTDGEIKRFDSRPWFDMADHIAGTNRAELIEESAKVTSLAKQLTECQAGQLNKDSVLKYVTEKLT